MLPSEPSERILLANDIYSNKRPGKLEMENGESSRRVCVQPKFKRRRVSAIRDFPPGCGRFVQRIILGPTQDPDPVISNGHESNGTHPGLSEDLQLVVAATLTDEDKIPFLADGNFFLPSNGSVDASNGNGFIKRLRNYPPRRKVSAVRDFPPNCGRYVPQLLVAEEANACGSPVKEVLVSEKSEPEVNGEKASTHVLEINDRNKMEDVRDGAVGRSEMSGNKMTTNVLQPKEFGSGMKGKTPDMTVENGISKLNKDVFQVKKSDELLASPMKGKEAAKPGVDKKPTTVTMKTVRKKSKSHARFKESPKEDTSRKSEGSGKGNPSLVLDKKLEVEMGIVDLKQTVDSRDSLKRKLEGRGCNGGEETIQSKGKNVAVEDESGTETNVEQMDKLCEPSFEETLVWWDHEAAVGNDDVGGSGDKLGTEKGTHSEVKSVIEMQSDPCGNRDQVERVDFETSEPALGRVVKDLKASPSCSQKQEKSALSSKLSDGMVEKKKKTPEMTSSVYGKRTKVTARKKIDENVIREMSLKKSSQKETSPGKGELVVVERDDSVKHWQKEKDVSVKKVSRRPSTFYIPPFHPSTSSGDSDRSKVNETLRLYHIQFRKLTKDDENAKSKDEKIRRIDLKAATYVKEKGKLSNQESKILGSVPGVEVGDEFQYRAELNIIGLHRQIQGGIDYTNYRGKIVATSVVASGGYSDDLESSDTLVYTGHGGNVMQGAKEPEDQKLERGNLSLKNSVDEQTPVRVIRGSESADAKSKTYVYDGLYLVDKYWQDVGPHGKLVYQFRLTRIPDQPELAWKEAKKRKKNKSRAGICMDDISNGKEVIPICAVNTVNDEKPPGFKYITKMIFPEWYKRSLPDGCGCNGKCSDSSKCACAVKNGGEIPFNHNGAIVEVKALVFECGPNCRCSASCPNRVSQHGIKYQLEIFKTEKMGWGVRSLNFIPSGGFVCEYLGELLSEKEADERTGNDEYLFDIGHNYNDNTFWEDEPDEASSSQASRDGCFTIDAVKFGNVGRFINHSCTPNLYAQNVLFDHDDSRIPRIMLFAAENIPAMRELTYHYNYIVDQVRDSNGNIKKKNCFCGTKECTGRLY